jgi:hypothetical protein
MFERLGAFCEGLAFIIMGAGIAAMFFVTP